MSADLSNTIFNVKMMSKQFTRASQKAEKRSKAEKAKVKKAIQSNNAVGARIYAENAIREHNCAQTFLRYSSRMDGLVSRLTMQSGMMAMTKALGQVTNSLQKAMNSMDMKEVSFFFFLFIYF